jgi:hypothetical protein
MWIIIVQLFFRTCVHWILWLGVRERARVRTLGWSLIFWIFQLEVRKCHRGCCNRQPSVRERTECHVSAVEKNVCAVPYRGCTDVKPCYDLLSMLTTAQSDVSVVDRCVLHNKLNGQVRVVTTVCSAPNEDLLLNCVYRVRFLWNVTKMNCFSFVLCWDMFHHVAVCSCLCFHNNAALCIWCYSNLSSILLSHFVVCRQTKNGICWTMTGR